MPKPLIGSLFTLMEPDLCQRKHGGNAQSEAAFARIRATLPQARAEVLKYIRSRGDQGATVKEIAAHFGKQVNCVSGRITELRYGDKLVRDSGKRRADCAVLVAAQL